MQNEEDRKLEPNADKQLKDRLIPKSIFDLEQKIEEIRCFFQPQLAVSIAIVKDGKVFLTKGFGPRIPNKPEQVDEKTLFNIGSITKSFVSLSLASLVSEGKLDFTTPVKNYFKDFKLIDAELTEKINLIHVLTHQTSLPCHDEVYILKKRLEISDLLARFEHFKLIPDGFGKFYYNNHMFTLASEISAKLNKKSLPETLREKVFKPAKMNETIMWEEVEDKSNLNMFTAAVLDIDPLSDSRIPDKFSALPISVNDDLFTVGSGCGGVLSHSVDMARYMQFLMSRAAGSLIKEKEFSEFVKPHINSQNPEKVNHYGLGIEVTEYEGNLSWDHDGQVFGYLAKMQILPEKELGVFVATNGYAHGPLMSITNVILDTLLEIPFEKKKNHPEYYAEEYKEEWKGKLRKFDEIVENKTMHQMDLSKYVGEFYNAGYGTFTLAFDAISKKIEGKLLDTTFFDFNHFDKEEFKCKSIYPNVNWAATTYYDKKSCWFDVENEEIVSVRLELEPGLKEGIIFLRV